jgi:Cu+-exporting ATPase
VRTLLVNGAALVLIGVIVWYFFLSRRDATSATSAGVERQEITIQVKGGYTPNVVHARPGVPLRLHFKREETAPCSEEVVFPSFGVRRALGAFETTTIDLPAAGPGTYAFSCGMDMLHGHIVVGDAPADMPAPAASHPSWPTDPVCGMKVDPTQAAASLERDGRTYYFCSLGCRDQFQKRPPASPAAVPLAMRTPKQPH